MELLHGLGLVSPSVLGWLLQSLVEWSPTTLKIILLKRCWRRCCDVEAQSASKQAWGGTGTGAPLAGARDVPDTTCRAWAPPTVSKAFCLFGALLGNFIASTSSTLFFHKCRQLMH
ncbi:UNVERIFIED_CONTAM: hypothetical protein Sradi_4124000 [Sesamum radiatum]|uniref:Uncharacterized protein n=1 Tax=Sesamum radiatum TaxID=300843 RepID=A0AAW2P3Z9_SESRA